MGLLFLPLLPPWNAEVMADIPIAILDYEEKGEPEGAQVAEDSKEPSHQSWTPYPQIFLPKREINFQFT